MPGEYYCRCPDCKTVFSLKQEHLSIAKGKVRCGACLQVFDAPNNLVVPEVKQKASSSSTKADPTAPPQATKEDATQQTTNLEDFDLHSQEEQPKEDRDDLLSDDVNPASFSTPSTSEVYTDNIIEDNNQQVLTNTMKSTEIQDKSSTKIENESLTHNEKPEEDSDFEEESLHFEHSSEEIDIKHSVSEGAENHKEESIDMSDEEEIWTPSSKQEIPGIDEEVSEDTMEISQDNSEITPIDSFTDEEETSELEQNQIPGANIPVEENDETDSIDIAELSLEEDSDNTSEVLEESYTPEIDQSKGTTIEENEIQELENDTEVELENQSFFNEESIAAETKPEQEQTNTESTALRTEENQETDESDPLKRLEKLTNTSNRWLYWSLSAAFLFVILLSVGYFLWPQRAELAYDETWGPLVTKTCKFLPCDIPARRDLKRIILQQRSIKPHTEQTNQLEINLMLLNSASFDQPYPTIEINFSDLDGKLVASHQYPPKQYLSATQLPKMMPKNVLVHINFSITTPHPQASGFEFKFL